MSNQQRRHRYDLAVSLGPLFLFYIDKPYKLFSKLGGKPGALFLEAAASAALEAEAKLREDPLYAIKKREEEQRRQLLNNPVRLKKLQKEVSNI